MTTYLYKLRFITPLHVSANGSNYEDAEALIHSDTLYSALCSVASQVYQNTQWVSVFLNQNESRIHISSTMPYFKDSLFLPKPFSFSPGNFDQWDYSIQKAWKKVAFFSWDAFREAIIEGRPIEEKEVKNQVSSGAFSHQAAALPPGKLFEFREVPRVTLDRISNSSTLFFYGDVTFIQDAGLYFLAKFADEEAKSIFETLLRILGDTGIGGDRTVGKGLFEVVESKTVELPDSEKGNAYLLLSLYTPKLEEMQILDIPRSFYQIKTRQGWVSNKTFRRQTVRAFTEGSVLVTINNQQPNGRLQEVLPPSFTGFSVYRYLKAFSIPIKL